jgi:hypothetical protein
MQVPHASWIIICPPVDMVIVSPAIATTDAADAAIPSTWTLTAARWLISALWMAMPSHALPPGELMWRSISSTSRWPISSTNMPAVTPQSEISS